ncbi:hypothetical protein CK503_06690 [Aliifodinibius salipaludis]|uniref:DUF805 domain-containing protein n=1 Tax=Fodinibius salipaludis TaxID=2032627 RepID=A0A2A2GCM0_9BACT|nr:DUF805 domain-containing protein [Aliifodinibius salipaludis]PAU94643.1 hypothetical protein CK503_06690 [Aliifodinibius salipaludis]
MEWYIKVLKNYAEFEGRARRKEYWMFTLVNFLIYAALQTLMFMLAGMNPESSVGLVLMGILGLYSLAVFIPSLAVGVRRLHDTGRSGWWLLISLVPIIGAIVIIVFLVQDSQPGTNQYGENPKEMGSAAVA